MKWNIAVEFKNGDVITTTINGTEQEVRDYYAIGKVFNLGAVTDNMQPVKCIRKLIRAEA